jgi:hypothetical protein
MLAEWAVRDEQPILVTSTNPCITGAAGTQRVDKIKDFKVLVVSKRLNMVSFW